jgi:hypothetical protein
LKLLNKNAFFHLRFFPFLFIQIHNQEVLGEKEEEVGFNEDEIWSIWRMNDAGVSQRSATGPSSKAATTAG